MDERWLPVVGFEESYEVSDRGNVRSFDRLRRNRFGTALRRAAPLRQQPHGKAGHLKVRLYRDGKSTQKFVHIAVLEAFVGPRPEGHQGLHWDDDQQNNVLENLRWGTRSDNAKDRVRNGLDPNASKTHCKRGHEFTKENTYVFPTGRGNGLGRTCRTCASMRARGEI